MAAKRKPKAKKKVTTLTHEDASRKNIPTVEYEAMMAEGDKTPVQVAYERRNRDLDPQFVWRGKDEKDWSDLVVQASPLYIQEKVHPKVLIDDLRRLTEADDQAADNQMDLFADFNGLPFFRFLFPTGGPDRIELCLRIPPWLFPCFSRCAGVQVGAGWPA